jgi:hypothetical protein
MGFRRQVLVGVDLEPDPETGEGHHYDGHPMAPEMPGEQAWNFSVASSACARLGIEVLVAYPHGSPWLESTTWTRDVGWRRLTLEEVF